MTDTTPVADFDCDEFGRITAFRKVVNYQGASIEEVRPGMIRVCLPTPDGGEDIVVIHGAVVSVYGHRMQTWTGGVAVVGGDLAAADTRLDVVNTYSPPPHDEV